MAACSSSPTSMSFSDAKSMSHSIGGSHADQASCGKGTGESMSVQNIGVQECTKLPHGLRGGGGGGSCRRQEVTDAQQVPSWSLGSRPQSEPSYEEEYEHGVVPDYKRERNEVASGRTARRATDCATNAKSHDLSQKSTPADEAQEDWEEGTPKKARGHQQVSSKASWWPTSASEWESIDAKSGISGGSSADGTVSADLLAANAVRKTIISQQNTFTEQVQELHRVVEQQNVFCRDTLASLNLPSSRKEGTERARLNEREGDGRQPWMHPSDAEGRSSDSGSFPPSEAKVEPASSVQGPNTGSNPVGGFYGWGWPSDFQPQNLNPNQNQNEKNQSQNPNPGQNQHQNQIQNASQIQQQHHHHHQREGERDRHPDITPLSINPSLPSDWSQYPSTHWMHAAASMAAAQRGGGGGGGGVWWNPGMQNHMAAMASWYAQHQAAAAWNQNPQQQQQPGGTIGAHSAQTLYTQPHPSYFQQWRMPSPSLSNPSFGNPSFGNPSFGNPPFGNPPFGNPSFDNSSFGNPSFGNPPFVNPSFVNPSFGNPSFGNPSFGNPSFGNPPFGKPPFSRASESGEWVAEGNGSMWQGSINTASVRPPFKRPPPLVLVRERDKLELKVVAMEKYGTSGDGGREKGQASAGSSSAEESVSVRERKNHSLKERSTRGGGGGGGGGGAGVQKGFSSNCQEPVTNSLSPGGGTSGGSGEGEGDVIDSGEPMTPVGRKPSPPLSVAPRQGEISSCQKRPENRDWLVDSARGSAREGGEREEDRKDQVECTVPFRPRPRRLEVRKQGQEGGVGREGERIQNYPRPGPDGQVSTWHHAIGSAFEAGKGLESQPPVEEGGEEEGTS